MPVVDQTIQNIMDSVASAVPRILTAILFVVVAAILIRVASSGIKRALKRTSNDNVVYREFATTLFRVFAWFGVSLAVLSILGLEQIAAAFGTATGFIALGVAYAVKEMLADAVAGVYLLKDPDFEAGDRIAIGGSTVGRVKQIELRKTRFENDDGDTVVKGNSKIEGEWTKRATSESPPIEPATSDSTTEE